MKKESKQALTDVKGSIAMYKQGFADGYSSAFGRLVEWKKIKKKCFEMFNVRFLAK